MPAGARGRASSARLPITAASSRARCRASASSARTSSSGSANGSCWRRTPPRPARETAMTDKPGRNKASRGDERQRLDAAARGLAPWRKWGPYLSERQWGTVREDYSTNGNAWEYFTHDQARSRAYHWGEDGLAGICDDAQQLCFALALWNGHDPILKERLFGLNNAEGNHV